MKTFYVYKHPTHGYEAVKQGFSWPAFFFNWLWAFIKKLWGIGFGFLGVMFILVFLETIFEEEGSAGGKLLMLLLQIGVFGGFGIKGNKWRRSSLQKRGFQQVKLVEAETPDAAIAVVARA